MKKSNYIYSLLKSENIFKYAAISIGTLLLLASCKEEYKWNLPQGIPEPVVPVENPMTYAKIELGRELFYEEKLSQDETMSCGSCHFQKYAFTDMKRSPRGIPAGQGQLHPRGSQHLVNASYYTMLTWANPVLDSLERQMGVPLFFTANAVKEMGLESEDYLLKLRADPKYIKLFAAAFEGESPEKTINEMHMRWAIASFIRTMTSFDSDYDRYMRGDKKAMSESAIRGMEIFNGEEAKCSKCHSGFNFTESVTTAGSKRVLEYRNNGVYGHDHYIKLPVGEQGLKEFTGKPEHEGKFRVPTLRNIAMTYPYMHDGSIACDNFKDAQDWNESCARESLKKVIEHYMSGGKPHETKDKLITGFKLNEDQKEDLINFIFSLNDEKFLNNPALSDPALSEKK
jgi:cytochrome c peroxidase